MRRYFLNPVLGSIRTVINTVCIGAGKNPNRKNLRIRYLLTLSLLAISANLVAAPLTPGKFNLADYKGKVVYLDFWASWCGPCKLSFPYMENISHSFASRDLVVIADNLDESRASAKAFLQDASPDFPIIFDQQGVIATRFNVSDMPSTVLIGRDGKVRYVHKGFYPSKEDEYTSHILTLLNEKK